MSDPPHKRLAILEFPDLVELRAEHMRLRRLRATEENGALALLAQKFQQKAAKAGVLVEDPQKRDAIQSMIDYWTSVIGSAQQVGYPQFVGLAEFDAKHTERFVSAADDFQNRFGGVAGPQDELVKLVLVEMALNKGTGEPPAFDENELNILGTERAQRIRGDLADIGLASRRSRDGVDIFRLRHQPILLSWPQLKAWLAGYTSRRVLFEKLVAEAENWKHKDRERRYVLEGHALAQARFFRSEPGLLGEYVRASDAARRQHAFVIVGVLALLVGAGVAAYHYGDSGRGQTREEGAKEIVQLDRSGEVPDDQVDNAVLSAALNPVPSRQETFMWLGSDINSKIQNSGGSVNPSNAVVGGTYVASRNLALRKDYPDVTSYRNKLRIGAMPSGARFFIVEKHAPFQRLSGEQYWAQVQRVATTYIHYADADLETAEGLRKQLDQLDFIEAMPVDKQQAASRMFQVRFSHVADAPLAQSVLESLYAILPPRAGIEPTCLPLTNRAPSERGAVGVIEVWIDWDLVGNGADPSVIPANLCAQAAQADIQTTSKVDP